MKIYSRQCLPKHLEVPVQTMVLLLSDLQTWNPCSKGGPYTIHSNRKFPPSTKHSKASHIAHLVRGEPSNAPAGKFPRRKRAGLRRQVSGGIRTLEVSLHRRRECFWCFCSSERISVLCHFWIWPLKLKVLKELCQKQYCIAQETNISETEHKLWGDDVFASQQDTFQGDMAIYIIYKGDFERKDGHRLFGATPSIRTHYPCPAQSGH